MPQKVGVDKRLCIKTLMCFNVLTFYILSGHLLLDQHTLSNDVRHVLVLGQSYPV